MSTVRLWIGVTHDLVKGHERLACYESGTGEELGGYAAIVKDRNQARALAEEESRGRAEAERARAEAEASVKVEHRRAEAEARARKKIPGHALRLGDPRTCIASRAPTILGEIPGHA